MPLAKVRDAGFFVRLKHVMPREVQSISVIPHVHYALARKLLANVSRNSLVHTSTVCDGRFTALRGSLHAEEPQLHRPRASISKFVVQRYRLIGRIFRG